MGWITSIIENARAEGIVLFIKENAGWKEKIREYQKALGSNLQNSIIDTKRGKYIFLAFTFSTNFRRS